MAIGIDHVKEERKFLHDISNHLLVAEGMGTFVKKQLEKDENTPEKVKNRMSKSLDAMEKIIDLIKSRREVLIKLCEELEES